MSNIVYAPSWINDLIIYEVATKSYTSPKGAESGTFNSLKEKLEYIHDLGITGIWLTGNCLCHPNHFYNIWTQYATIRPDELDPSLGTKEDFKELIEKAHSLGIKVFLDVITHGVMSSSSLIEQHPDWFKEGTWGMTDYDWFGEHKDLDEWWINTWVNYVKEFGIDGFRLDIAMYRQDLWARIKKEAADFGHPIIIFNESGPAYPGTCEFTHLETRISENLGFDKKHKLLKDVSEYVNFIMKPESMDYEIEIIYDDYTATTSNEERSFGFSRLYKEIQGIKREIKSDDILGSTYIENKLIIQVKNMNESKEIKNIIVRSNDGKEWNLVNPVAHDYKLEYDGKAPIIKIYIPISLPEETYFSVQLSCHDNGWEGYPENESPYAAQGSRFVLGYSTLFTPGVPIFMAGEEFNADFVPLPKLSPDLYGGNRPGEGKWLYGSWIQWEQLEDEDKKLMLKDVQKMISIRKKESDLINPMRVGESMEGFGSVSYESEDEIPVPYAYYNEDKILIVAGNPYENKDVKVKLKLNLKEIKAWGDCSTVKIIDLWNDESRECQIDDFENIEWMINKDKVANGGILILKIVKVKK